MRQKLFFFCSAQTLHKTAFTKLNYQKQELFFLIIINSCYCLNNRFLFLLSPLLLATQFLHALAIFTRQLFHPKACTRTDALVGDDNNQSRRGYLGGKPSSNGNRVNGSKVREPPSSSGSWCLNRPPPRSMHGYLYTLNP